MTASQLLSHLRELGVEVTRQGDRLRFNGPVGAVTPALRAELAARKAELLRFLGKLEHRGPSDAGRLVAMQPRGTKPPVVFIHPVGGNVFCYTELARLLRPDRPFYALSARGFDGVEPPSKDLASMASDYIADLRHLLDQGSTVLLGGWSMGGVVAFEMACQLSAQGHEASPLLLLESYVPRREERTKQQLVELFSADLGLQLRALDIDEDALFDDNFELRMDYLLEKVKQADIPAADLTIERLHRRYQVFKANLEASDSYAPRPYRGRIELLRCGRDPSDGESVPDWNELAERVTVHAVPGNHFTFLREPYVSDVAEVLQGCIDAT